MTTVTAYSIALKLLTLGYSVIPSGGGDKGKAPLVDWQRYQTSPPELDQLEEWERQLKPALWGIVTNDRIAVIDADTKEARAQLVTELGEPHIATPRGGAHWYIDTTGHPIKTQAGLLPSFDARGVGGFVNIAGGKYQILRLPAPDALIPWTKLPKRILQALNGSQASAPAAQGKPIPDGQRNDRLTRIAGGLRRQGLDQETIEAALRQVKCVNPLPDVEIKAIAASVCRYAPHDYTPQKSKTPVTYKDTPILRKVKDIEPEAVSWLWKPYIPYAKLTLLEGDPGVGKSWIALAIATGLTLGMGLPGQEGRVHAPVLIASAEDGLADTIRPRLDAMGADITAITAIDGLFCLDDEGFTLLEGWIEETMPGLLILDPLVGYLSSEIDIHKANQVRHGTARLAKLATKYGLAILAIRHLTKGGSLKPIYRGLGSIDFTASARSVLMAGCDPDIPNIRGIIHIKSNLAPTGAAIGYELRDDGFYWTAGCDLTIERIFAVSEGTSALTEAKSFLLELLADGEVSANEGLDEAKAKGVTEATLKRAKGELHIVTCRAGEKGKKGGGTWYWKLPEGDKNED